jgi:hypothetical protein
MTAKNRERTSGNVMSVKRAHSEKFPMTPRRWFRFGLKTMLVVVTAFACWLGCSLHWMREREKGRQWLRAFGTDCGDTGTVTAPGLLWLLGEKGQNWFFVHSGAPKSEVDRLKTLFPETTFFGSGE